MDFLMLRVVPVLIQMQQHISPYTNFRKVLQDLSYIDVFKFIQWILDSS
jgi:hypothetical protein